MPTHSRRRPVLQTARSAFVTLTLSDREVLVAEAWAMGLGTYEWGLSYVG
jgi:hypothetical protein